MKVSWNWKENFKLVFHFLQKFLAFHFLQKSIIFFWSRSYEWFTSLYLQPYENKSFLQSFVVTSHVKLYLLVLVGWSTTYLKVKTSVSGLNLTTLVTACDYKKTLVFSQVGKYKLVNWSLDRRLIEQSKQMFWMEKTDFTLFNPTLQNNSGLIQQHCQKIYKLVKSILDHRHSWLSWCFWQ